MRRVLERHNRDPLFTSHEGRWETLTAQTFDERKDGIDALIYAAFLPYGRDVTARRQSTGRVRCQSIRVSPSHPQGMMGQNATGMDQLTRSRNQAATEELALKSGLKQFLLKFQEDYIHQSV